MKRTEGIPGCSGGDDDERKRLRLEESPSSCEENAFELYRRHLDVEDEHDLSNLEELVHVLGKERMVAPIEPFREPISSLQSTADLLPILFSVTLHQLASSAFDKYLAAEQENDNDECKSRLLLKKVLGYISRSLAIFPRNAACWSMGANICRITGTLSRESIVNWYRQAATNARHVRKETLDLLEREDLDDSIKEWLELLLLHQVVDVEYLHDDKDDHNEEGTFSASSVEATARFMLAMLLSRDGQHEEALSYLQTMDVTHRLHPNVWTGQQGRSFDTGSEAAVASSRAPVFFSGALPTDLYKRMCQVFAPDAAFWRDTGYYGNPGYYSFLAKTHDGSNGFNNVIDEVVCGHLLPLVCQFLGDEADNICAYEWWAHTRPDTSLGHMMHFDTDEANLKDQTKVHHPIVSSVLHLVGDSKSGATIILDQTPDSTELASVCWRSEPHPNTFMIFPGNLLHGVLPSSAAEITSDADTSNMSATSSTVMPPVREWPTPPSSSEQQQSRRLTVMVGFKTRIVPDQRNGKTLYGPCAPLPANSEWVKDIQIGYNGKSSQTSKELDRDTPFRTVRNMQNLPYVLPAWECIPKHNQRDPLLQLPAIDQRFFVKGAPACFRDNVFENDDSNSNSDACDQADN